MKHGLTFMNLATVATVVLLSACGDKPQEMGSGVRPDTAAFNGTQTAFVASGWKQGDKASWEQQMRVRTQNGQNEYPKAK